MDKDQVQRILERKAGSSSGVGLINTDQRLKRHFGTGLDIQSTVDTGTKVTFHVRNRSSRADTIDPLSERYHT